MNISFLNENFWIILISPFVLMLLTYLIISFFHIHQWRKIHLTAQWSALFFVAGVIIIVQELYGFFLLSYLLIVFLLFLAIHITIQWRHEETISLNKAIVVLLRSVFLLFLIGYLVLLTIYGIRLFA